MSKFWSPNLIHLISEFHLSKFLVQKLFGFKDILIQMQTYTDTDTCLMIILIAILLTDTDIIISNYFCFGSILLAPKQHRISTPPVDVFDTCPKKYLKSDAPFKIERDSIMTHPKKCTKGSRHPPAPFWHFLECTILAYNCQAQLQIQPSSKLR